MRKSVLQWAFFALALRAFAFAGELQPFEDTVRMALGNEAMVKALLEEMVPAREEVARAVSLRLKEGAKKRVPAPSLFNSAQTLLRACNTVYLGLEKAGDPRSFGLRTNSQIYSYLADTTSAGMAASYFLRMCGAWVKQEKITESVFFKALDQCVAAMMSGVSPETSAELIINFLGHEKKLSLMGESLSLYFNQASLRSVGPDRAARLLIALDGPVSRKKLLQMLEDEH